MSETLNVFDNTEGRTPIVVVYDARGNGGVRYPPPSRATIKTV